MSEPLKMRNVRFLVYHGGMGADVGDKLIVPAEWAERAVKAGIVEYVAEDKPKGEAKPDI